MDTPLLFDMDNAVGYAIGRTAGRLKIGLRRTFLAHGHDVTPEQWVVLYRLYETPGLSQAELGERSVKDKTTITRILDRLSDKDLLTRRRDPLDRRSQRIDLTPAGRALVGQLVPLVRAYATASFADVPPEDSETLRRILGNIEARLDILLEA
ncbi:MAG: MarR family transcriptional regulator [Solidesulfovibrio sp.]|uniref:MarR family winged helix-turn-helix transcriptional regulator n=1 Tax=Solidesulfovibrio sp. TaxID=2910990 RepID=UPI002B2122F1|nr:MarR family transcriptional regulator [Solidesulfovibrio sp.]MEA4857811.1 MarR family transcriptional regulator [Solidesulfovibrio sp.]